MLCGRNTLPRYQDGRWAWLVCFCCFASNVILYGHMLSYGVLLPVFMKVFNTSKGLTAWVGSLALGMSFLCGPLSIKVINLFGERPVGSCSGVLAAVLVFASSFVKNIWLLFITYGVLFGICVNFLICSSTKSLQRYFKRHLGMATGIASSGGSMGVLLLSPFLQMLVDRLEWQSALRVMSGVVLLAGLTCLPFDPNVENGKGQEHIITEDRQSTTAQHGCKFYCSIWKSSKYTVATISIFLNFLCLLVPLIHLVTFAKERNIPPSASSLLYIYSGICSTVTRIVNGKIIDKKWLTPLRSIQISSYVIGCSLLLLSLARVYWHFVLCILCYGFGNGIFVSAQYNFLLTCFKEPKKSYVGFTMCYTMSSFALLSGAPLAGFVADIFNSYTPAFYIFGGLIFFSGTLPFSLVFLSKRKTSMELEQRLELIGSRLASNTIESSPKLTK